MTIPLHIKALYQYPLKSARGIALASGQINPLGLEQDRRWVLVDAHGVFLSQRSCAAMGAIEALADGRRLTLRFKAQTYVAIADPDDVVVATVWSDQIAGCYGVQPEINQWLSEALGQAVRLLYCPDHAMRIVDEHYAGLGQRTAFSDGFPLLLLSQSSLDELSRRWGSTIDPRRFRPNIIIGGDCAPFAEDQWRRVYISDSIHGERVLELVKPCSRCVIPSLDPETLQSTDGFLRFLAGQRRLADGKVYLGQNALLRQPLMSEGLAEVGADFAVAAESPRQSLAESASLLHTKKEQQKNASDFTQFIAPTLTLGNQVRVE